MGITVCIIWRLAQLGDGDVTQSLSQPFFGSLNCPVRAGSRCTHAQERGLGSSQWQSHDCNAGLDAWAGILPPNSFPTKTSLVAFPFFRLYRFFLVLLEMSRGYLHPLDSLQTDTQIS